MAIGAEVDRCAQTLLAIQGTCHHKRKTCSSQKLAGKYITIYQCVDCGLYNPGEYGFVPAVDLIPIR